ncbi:MAG TPA: hypothetical protein VHR18_02200 [Solirubrobacterales bacterium]|nr:hypothetical protein [Solirubrobacterales bacterium]
MAPWKLPLIVLAIAVPITAAFLLGGPGVGVAMGALVAVVIVYVAARQPPRGALGSTGGATVSTRLLLAAACPVEDPAVIAAVAALAVARGGAEVVVLVLAPARIGFLDRWASDVEGARAEAQRSLVMTVASLAKAGVEAEARVGDEDLVQAVEDQLQSFDATDVLLVSEDAERDPGAAAAAAELEERLRPRFRWLTLSGPAAR